LREQVLTQPSDSLDSNGTDGLQSGELADIKVTFDDADNSLPASILEPVQETKSTRVEAFLEVGFPDEDCDSEG